MIAARSRRGTSPRAPSALVVALGLGFVVVAAVGLVWPSHVRRVAVTITVTFAPTTDVTGSQIELRDPTNKRRPEKARVKAASTTVPVPPGMYDVCLQPKAGARVKVEAGFVVKDTFTCQVAVSVPAGKPIPVFFTIEALP